MCKIFFVLFLFAPVLVQSAKCPQFTNITHPFSLNFYTGSWYEIARTDVVYEKDLDCVRATYTLKQDGNISILNEGKDLKTGTYQDAVGTATPTNQDNVLEVRFNPKAPSVPYWIVDSDLFTFSVVVSCFETKDDVILDGWILSRLRTVFKPMLDQLVAKLEKVGIPKTRLRMTEQGKC